MTGDFCNFFDVVMAKYTLKSNKKWHYYLILKRNGVFDQDSFIDFFMEED